MFKKMKARLRSKRGESLSEVLIALLISTLALTILGSMIATTQRIVKRTNTASQNYVVGNNALAEKKETARSGEGNVSIRVQEVANGPFKGMDLTDNSGATIPVEYFINKSLKNVAVTSYQKGGGS